MRLSKNQRSRLYSAIAGEIAMVRMKLRRSASQHYTNYGGGTLPADTVDAEMYHLERCACKAAIDEMERDARTRRN